MNFIEYIEINRNAIIESTHSLNVEAGSYLCVSLLLDEDHDLDWNEIKTTVSNIICTEEISVRGSKMIFVNNDNMNFNFIDSKRILSIQIPIQ